MQIPKRVSTILNGNNFSYRRTSTTNRILCRCTLPAKKTTTRSEFWIIIKIKKNMKIFIDKWCIERTKTFKKRSDKQLWRDVLAYWILGLTCEFGYVVIISGANDILHGFEQLNVYLMCLKIVSLWFNHFFYIQSNNITIDDPATIRKTTCDAPSTGILLIADILPSMLMSFFCPFLPLVKKYVKYPQRNVTFIEFWTSFDINKQVYVFILHFKQSLAKISSSLLLHLVSVW